MIDLLIKLYFRFFLGRPSLARRARFYIPDWKSFFSTGLNELNYLLRRNRGFRLTSAVVEISSRCNLNCIMCARHKVFNREEREMTLETFTSLVDRNPNMELYILVGWGEMMLHRQFFQMVEYLRKAGKRIALTTNGTLLSKDNIERVIESGISHITISMDGINGVFESIRGIPFEKVEKNLIALSKHIKEKGKNIYLEINSISSPEVMEQSEEIRARLRPYVDEIRFSSCVDYNNLLPTNRANPCRELWRGMISVLVDGSVVPCCMDYNASMVLGHVQDSTLQDLWNNEIARSLRKEHLALQFKHRCSTCFEMQPPKDVEKRFD